MPRAVGSAASQHYATRNSTATTGDILIQIHDVNIARQLNLFVHDLIAERRPRGETHQHTGLDVVGQLFLQLVRTPDPKDIPNSIARSREGDSLSAGGPAKRPTVAFVEGQLYRRSSTKWHNHHLLIVPSLRLVSDELSIRGPARKPCEARFKCQLFCSSRIDPLQADVRKTIR